MYPNIRLSLKVRRGVGTIIGGSFIILVMLSAYSFYLVNNKIQNEYNNVLSNMRSEDIDKEQENLIIIDIDKDRYNPEYEPDYPDVELYTIWVHVKNDGPKLSQILYYQISDYVNSNNYEIVEKLKTISPGESGIIDVIVPDEDEDISHYVIQLITSKGNIYSSEYPSVPPGYLQLLSDLNDVIGDILPVYKTFSWSKINSDDNTIIKWNNDWRITKTQGENNEKWYAISIKVRYFGTGDLTIKKESFIYLQNLEKQEFKELYLVTLDEDKIIPYEEVILLENNVQSEIEFIFAASEAGGLPGNSQLFSIGDVWQVSLTFLGISEEGTQTEQPYGQSFPLIAFTVEEEIK
jgi:hypothetical protein